MLVDRQNLVLWRDMSLMSQATISAKQGAASGGPALPSATPAGQAAAPAGDTSAPPAEALRSLQVATYRRRLAAALTTLTPVAEETHPAVADTTDAVYSQLQKNWPPKAIAWVRDAEWEGPLNVGLHHVDTHDRGDWTASHEPDRVAKMQKKLRKRIAAGDHPKPVVLVRTPGSAKDLIADGHHHFLAAENEGQHAVWAYVGRVSSERGPWDSMRHSRQLVNGKLPPKSPADDQMDGSAK